MIDDAPRRERPTRDGETAPRVKHHVYEGRLDSEEDAILNKIDAERGYALDVVLERWPRVENRRMGGVLMAVERVSVDSLVPFEERLVRIMETSAPSGGGSATRAYVLVRALRAKARDEVGDGPVELLMSPEGAQSFAAELRAFLPKRKQHKLRPLLDALRAALESHANPEAPKPFVYRAPRKRREP